MNSDTEAGFCFFSFLDVICFGAGWVSGGGRAVQFASLIEPVPSSVLWCNIPSFSESSGA